MAKCAKLEARRFCGYTDCTHAATCFTNLYGFTVLACQEHHTCGATRNDSPLE